MILVPVYITLYCMQHYRLSGAVFLLAGITDVVDGYIARRNNWVTDIGKLLDPLADKLMCISAVTCLTWVGERDPHLPFWIFIIIVVKELLQISGAALILGEKKIYVHSRWYGKVSTVILYIVILSVTFCEDIKAAFGEQLLTQNIIDIMCAVSVAIMIFTFISYAFDYRSASKMDSDPIKIQELDEKLDEKKEAELDRKIDERIDEKLQSINKNQK